MGGVLLLLAKLVPCYPSGLSGSFRKPSLNPTPLPKSGLDVPPEASDSLGGFPSNNTCHIQSQVPVVHPRSPSRSLSHLEGAELPLPHSGLF